MKLNSPLILTKNTKKSKKNLKALKKTKLVLLPSCIRPCKQEWEHFLPQILTVCD